MINQKNWDEARKLIAPDFVGHFPGMPDIHGVEGFVQLCQMYQAGFPDFKFVIDDLVAEGDKVVALWTWRGTHQGSFMGIPSSGKQVTIDGVSTFRLKDGKLVEQSNSQDNLGIMQQIGVIPMPNQMPG